MRVLVCGGRDYAERDRVTWELDRWAMRHDDLVIICGFDPDDDRFQGADQLAYEWARSYSVPVFPFPAPWRKHGRSAGPRRNTRMIECGRPDACLHFPGGRGTDDMVSKAQLAGVRVVAAYR